MTPPRVSLTDLSVYSEVVDSGVAQLPSGKWCAVVSARVKEPGYDIPPIEDMFHNFDDEEQAQAWVEDRIRQIEAHGP